MSTAAGTLDTQELEQRVRGMDEGMARDASRDFHPETGRALGERLGYPAADLDRIPAIADNAVRRYGVTSISLLARRH